jgi:hypothetical protein
MEQKVGFIPMTSGFVCHHFLGVLSSSFILPICVFPKAEIGCMNAVKRNRKENVKNILVTN